MTAAAKATAVIAAAGAGARLGAGDPKALVPVGGRPLVAWSADALAAAECVEAIVIAAPPGREDALRAAVAVEVPLTVVAGGESRADSVAAAVVGLDTVELVAVHDAARPLVTAGLVDAVVERLVSRPDADGAIAAAPITDTVKRTQEPRPASGEPPPDAPTVVTSESREHLWVAQTPQVFRARALREALAAGPRRVAAATDEAMLVEQSGGKILIHPSSATNLKVTTPDDLRLAEALLSGA